MSSEIIQITDNVMKKGCDKLFSQVPHISHPEKSVPSNSTL